MDGSGAPRANAAQLASRNIKQLKGRRGGARASPVPSSPANFGSSQSSQPFQFQPPSGTSGGGGFNFAAPTNGTFNNPFANSNGAAPMTDNDERRDPAEEPFGKRGRHTNGGDGDSMPLFAPMPTNAFGGSTNGQQSGGLFSGFGQSSSINGGQSQASTPAPIFAGFGQAQPAAAPFSPAPVPQTSGSFNFNFGAPAASPQPQTASASFPPFNQTPSQPKSTGFQFGSTTATTTPASNLFGTSQAPSTNLFGSKPSTPTIPATDLFGKKEASPAPPTNLFGSTPQPSASNLFGNSTPATSNPFGSRDASPAPSIPTSNLFGTQSSTSNMFSSSVPATRNVFSQVPPTPAAAPTPQKPFASLSQPPTSNLFSSSAPAANNLFGSRDPSPALSANGSTQPATGEQTPKQNTGFVFGQPNQDASQKPASTSLFGNIPQPSTSSTIFGETKSQGAPLFGNLGQSNATSSTPLKPPVSSSLFGNTPKADSTELFGALNKPVDKSVTDPKQGTPFSFSEPAVKPQSASVFGNQPSPSKPFTPGTPSGSLSFTPTQNAAASASKPLFSFTPASATPPPAPQPAKASLSSQNSSEVPVSTSTSETSSIELFSRTPVPAQSISAEQPRQSIVNGTHAPGSIGESVERLRNTKPTDKPNHDGKDFKDLSIATQIPDEYMQDLVPADFTDSQREDFYCAYRIRALNRAMSVYFASLQSAADPANALKFYNEQRKVLMDAIRSRNSKNPQGLTRSEAIASKQAKFIENNRSRTTHTSISHEKQQSISDLPPSQPSTANGIQSSASENRPSSTLFSAVPSLPPPNEQSISSSKGKRKAEDNLDQNNVDQHNKRPMRKIATPKSSGTAASSGGSTTSNIFKDILDSPAKSPEKSPAKRTAALPAPSTVPASTTPKTNPFGSLYVPKSAAKTGTNASPAASPFFGNSVATPTALNSSATAPALFGKSAAPTTTTTVSTPAPASSDFKPLGTAATTPAAPPAITGFKLAGFNPSSTSNFASQFGKQAKLSEEEQMLKEMADDIDSDEDDEAKDKWKADWKAKRKADLEKRNAEVAAATNAFTFKPSQIANKESSPSAKSGPLVETPVAVKSLFGASTSVVGAQNSSLFGSDNLSRTNSPSPAPSSSSIFDNQATSKPATFGNNIFGHLSKSSDDSGKDNDADDESEDDADVDADSENKDPNYTPGKDSSGPGTPADETGAGIASAKKSNPFTFSASKTGSVFAGSPSGTSTPGGSLFGRITRDTSAKPPSPSSEEKENTQPASTGLFSGLNKSQNGPVDQTWKPDSPIKFGNATPSSESKLVTPTVNITAATPTKSASPGLFGNLNTSGTPTSSPFSNLFASSTAAKPAASPSVGFNFGGPSNASSLFPSATTSRATTPGATTDGDSATEDPDAEKYEQISLTSGAGEEDEVVKLEVRAKAMQFLTKEDGTSGWETKGLGVLKVLQHKETKASRVLLRAEPRGNIVLNKAILGQFKYEATAKTVKLTTAGEVGKGLETWVLQVKTPEIAKELAEALEANKAT